MINNSGGVMSKQMVFVKFGGSSITNPQKPLVAEKEVIKRLFREVTEARLLRDFDVIIGHGSGSFGHIPSKKYKLNEEGLKNSESLLGSTITEQEVAQLHMIVMEVALKENIPVFSFSPHTLGMATNLKFHIAYEDHIKNAIRFGFIPVMYGDIVIDSERGVADISTEEVLKALSFKIRPDVVVISTDVDGLFSRNPKTNKDTKLIKLVDSNNIEDALACADSSTKVDSTGGMKTKVLSLFETVKATGAVGYITNANRTGALKDVLLGKDAECTVFRP